MNVVFRALGNYPVIASVKDDAALEHAMESRCPVLTILYGNITTIDSIVNRAKESGKAVLVNVDLIDGYAARAAVIADLKSRCAVDGILSSKALMVKAGREAGLVAGQRSFMIDSFAYHQLPSQVKQSKPDFLEILPGCVPRVIGWIRQDLSIPLIAGGLVCDPRDVRDALAAGARAVATSDQSLWNLPVSSAAG